MEFSAFDKIFNWNGPTGHFGIREGDFCWWGGCSSVGRAGRPVTGRSLVHIPAPLNWAACRSVLEQDAEPRIAPEDPATLPLLGDSWDWLQQQTPQLLEKGIKWLQTMTWLLLGFENTKAINTFEMQSRSFLISGLKPLDSTVEKWAAIIFTLWKSWR